ncbi:MAG: metal ABC transporter permease [Planctomycetota bacterium]
MTPLIIWTMLIGVCTAVACGLCGVFLVIKREAFISEGLSHAVLPGIVLAYVWVEDRSSPWLIISAGLSGLLMVWLVDWIAGSKRVDRDAALGIVFSGLFSVGIVVSALELGKVHFHAHCIIDGNLALAAVRKTELPLVGELPMAFMTIFGMLMVLVGFVLLFFKELKLHAMDETMAKLLGFQTKWLYTVWLALVAMTTVAAFEIAGTILVVALMVVPAATANLLTYRLAHLIWLSCGLSALTSVAGIAMSIQLDVSPAGLVSACSGVLFVLVAMYRLVRDRRRNLLPASGH